MAIERSMGVMAHSLSQMLSTNTTKVFLHDRVDVNKHQQMIQPKQQESLIDRWNYLLSLAGKERPDVAAFPGIGQSNITNWLTRDRGFTDSGIAKVRKWASQEGIEGLTAEWLNDGDGPPPRRTGPAVVPTALREAGNLASLVMDASPLQREGYVRFQMLAGFGEAPSPFVDIPSFLLREKPSWLTPSVRVLPYDSDVMRGEIDKGDYVFIDTAVNQVKRDGVYAYKINGLPEIRRIQIRGGGVLRFKGTHTYEDSLDLQGRELEDLEIGGRVIGRIGSSNF